MATGFMTSALGQHVRGRAAIVALTVDAHEKAIAGIIDALRPDLLQLHGNEAPERIEYLRAKFNRPLMKAVGIARRDDLEAAQAYSMADRLLIDAKAPADALLPGGNGVPFDWRLLDGFVSPACLSCCRAGSMPATSARRSGWRDRPASMSLLASSARPA